MKPLFVLFLVSLLWFTKAAHAQPRILDSLTAELINHKKQDTVRVTILQYLSQYTSESEPKKAKDYAEQSLQLAQELGYKRGIAQAYRQISQYYWNQTDPTNSMRFAVLALKEFEQCNMPRGISISHGLMGMIYAQSKDFAKALDHYKISVELSRSINDKLLLGSQINNMGKVLEEEKKYDSALLCYNQALELFESSGDKLRLIVALNNVGSIYNHLGDFTLAQHYLFKALSSAEELNNKDLIALTYQNIAEFYLKTGKYNKSREYIEKSIRIANEISNKRRKEGAYELLKELEVSQRNYKAAFHYLEKLLYLKDTLYNQERVKKTIELETQYETEKKTQTIQLLEQEKRIQTIWRNVLIVGVLLSFVASFFIYRLHRSRTRKTKQLLDIQEILNEKLKEVDKLKSGFFANISHEFRTPLTLILGPLEEELKTKSGSGKEPLLLVKRSANRLLELVNQLLDLSKLGAGKMELHIKHDTIQSFLKVIAASFDSLAQLKQIHFLKNIEVTEQPLCYDNDKVEKIITNLLANAFKFTPANGTVTFTVTHQKSPAKSRLSIRVSDTGKGIPEEEHELIFSSFYQTKQTIEGEEGGTGLGLSLVKELIKLYGGTISLQSTVNVGTAFLVELPTDIEAFPEAQLVEASTSTSSTPAHLSEDYEYEDAAVEQERIIDDKDTVLIVEDNADLRKFMSSILEHDFAVLTASDGQEALELAFNTIPNLVLTDLMMPKLDGIQLTEKIKTDERTSHIPVILLTAKNEQQSRIQGLRTGADDYLTKPFSTEELLVRITNLIDQRKVLAARVRERILVPVTSTNESSLDDKFLQKVREAVETHLSNASFSVDELADEVHLNRKQLLRKLKALTGLSPTDFIKDLRLKKAADMIRQRADTITQIGYAVGFNDQSYFSKCFKKEYGLTPKEYLMQSTQNKEVTPKE